MKKHISFMLAVVMLMTTVLTGCMSSEITVNFKSDSTGTVTVGMYFADEALNDLGITADELFEESEGQKDTKKINGKDYTGIIDTQTFSSINDLNALLGESAMDGTEDAAGLSFTKSVKNGKEIVTLTGKIESDAAIVSGEKDAANSGELNISEEDQKELEEALNNIVTITLSLTFPDGVTGVQGIDKNSYRLENNTITTTITSGKTAKNFVISGSLGTASYQRFPEIKKYDNRFKDVPADAWYRDKLIKAYNIGIIAGTTDTSFSPNAYLTLAQVTVMAARVRSLYDGDGATFKKAKESDDWYKPYVDYAVKKGILNNSKEFSDYTRPATRAEMVHIFSKSLPASAFVPVNGPKVFKDVPSSHKYYNDIMTMYSAGVVNGTSGDTFSASSNVTRAQASVIIARVAEIGDKIPR